MNDEKLYAERDIDDLVYHYAKHVIAMTAERLHSKSAIAAELAYRDFQIEALTDRNKILQSKLLDARLVGLKRTRPEPETLWP